MKLFFWFLGSIDLIAVVFERCRRWICDQVGESFALHQKIPAIPFVLRPCEMSRAAELFNIVGYFASLGLAKNKAVLTV